MLIRFLDSSVPRCSVGLRAISLDRRGVRTVLDNNMCGGVQKDVQSTRTVNYGKDAPYLRP